VARVLILRPNRSVSTGTIAPINKNAVIQNKLIVAPCSIYFSTIITRL
jgi:hypothetical protein